MTPLRELWRWDIVRSGEEVFNHIRSFLSRRGNGRKRGKIFLKTLFDIDLINKHYRLDCEGIMFVVILGSDSTLPTEQHNAILLCLSIWHDLGLLQQSQVLIKADPFSAPFSLRMTKLPTKQINICLSVYTLWIVHFASSPVFSNTVSDTFKLRLLLILNRNVHCVM